MRTSLFCRLRPSCIIRALLAVVAALLLTSCSVVRLGYNQLPELVYWWVDGFVDLNDAQSGVLRQDLQTLHDWHRRQELPVLASTLAALQTDAAQNVTSAQLCRWVEVLKPRVQAVADQSEAGLATLAARLTPDQLAHLQRQLEKRQQKWRDEWLAGSLAERLARRQERLLDRAHDFYGQLSATQQALLRASVVTSPFDVHLAQAEMLRRQQDFFQTLQTMANAGQSAQRMRAEVHQLLDRTLNSPTAAYRINIAEVTQANCDTFAALHNSSTAFQRTHLIAKLKGLEDDARALMPSAR